MVLFLQVIDIAVYPTYQGRGLGKAIVDQIVGQVRRTAPVGAHVSPLLDGEAHRLNAQFGFSPIAPASIGIAFRFG